MDGRSIKIFIRENDAVSLNVHNVVIAYRRSQTFSEFHFEISKPPLFFRHIDSLQSLLATIRDKQRFILYDETEKIYAKEFYEKSREVANVSQIALIPFYTDLKGMVSGADINRLGFEDKNKM